jgi:hypothetical protein
MRSNHPLHERHLLDAVRSNIITAEQYEAIMGIARAPSSGDGTVPDLGWVGVAQTFAAGFVALAPFVYLSAEYESMSAVAFMVIVAALCVASMGVGHLARTRGWGRAPAAIFSTMAPVYGGGVALALAIGLGPRGFWSDARGVFYTSRLSIIGAQMLGFAVVALATFVLWRVRRVGPAAGVAAASLVAMLLKGVSLTYGGYMPSATMRPMLLVMGAAVFALGWIMDARRRADGVDGAFWVHLTAIPVVGVALIDLIDRDATTWPIGVLAIVVSLVYGLRFNRRLHLTMAALGLLIVPAYSLGEANAASWLVLASLVASAAVIAVAAGTVRRYLRDRAIAHTTPEDTSTVWE